MEVEVIAHVNNTLGEGPIWHSSEQCLYWTDILDCKLFRFDPVNDAYEVVSEGHPITGITIQEDDTLLVFRDHGTVDVLGNGQVIKTIIDAIPEDAQTRFNDVIADPGGRVFCGNIANKDCTGKLYRLDQDGSYSVVVRGVECSNGMAFTLDCKQMYYTDSMARTIRIYDYDEDMAEISNERCFARIKPPAFPDGLTVDAEGNVWSARWDGACVVCYDQNGKEQDRVELPTAQITSVMFGGSDLSQLYITSAAQGRDVAKDRHAGDLFRITPGVKGRPEFRSRIGL